MGACGNVSTEEHTNGQSSSCPESRDKTRDISAVNQVGKKKKMDYKDLCKNLIDHMQRQDFSSSESTCSTGENQNKCKATRLHNPTWLGRALA